MTHIPSAKPDRSLVRTLSMTLSCIALQAAAMHSATAQTTAGMTTNPGLGTLNTDQGDSKWSFGLAGGLNHRVYRDFDNQLRGVPLLTFENNWVHVYGPAVDLKLPSLGPVALRLRGRYIGEGYEADDSPYLRGMRDRDSSFWLGGVATWRTQVANLSAEVLTDAMGNSRGSRAKLQVDRRYGAGPFGVTPRVAAEWLDRKQVNYYFGVLPTEVLAGRPAYEGGSTVNAEVGLRLDWMPAPRHAVFMDFGGTRMGSAIRSSPLVEQRTQYGLGLGYFHRF